MEKTEMVHISEFAEWENNPNIEILAKEKFSICTPALGPWSGYSVTYRKRSFFERNKIGFAPVFSIILLFCSIFTFVVAIIIFDSPRGQTKTLLVHETENMYIWSEFSQNGGFPLRTYETPKLNDYKETFERISKQ